MFFRASLVVLAAAFVLGCGKQESPQQAKGGRAGGQAATLITVAKSELTRLDITEETVGILENIMDPRVGAEIAGRVVSVHTDAGKHVKRGQLIAEIDSSDQEIQGRSDNAEVARLEGLLANQDRIVERQTQLVKQNFISQNALDDATAQRNALRQQLAGAKARVDAGRNAMRKTRVLAPIEGRIEQRLVNPGDFVKVGDSLFRLVGTQVLRAQLPFPESASNRIKAGLPVKLSSPLVPGKVIEARINEIRPTITATSRALNAIVQFANDGSFAGGGTVNAEVVTSVKNNVVMVPEQSVVLRPAGKVVYIVNEGKALQQVVETGHRKDGRVEIVSGLSGGETIALDGAGFLTHNAAVALPQPRAAKAGAGKGGRGNAEQKDKSGEAPAGMRPAQNSDKQLPPGMSRI